ncbi:hypothetical protein [Anatilimnocola floriformis]|uniref:hypothetical protein n=1 Tax=Anatilimnocola floriformis TaxID=2948575 RepID=UPI0020C326E6|nr:hypothetical protein [Anatilimnocola floriformis]
MSYVLEAIGVPAGISLPTDNEDGEITFELFSLSGVNLLARTGGRVVFSPRMLEIAKRLSLQHGAAMLIRWDDRVGMRQAVVYQQGAITREFGEDDEIYVAIADAGLPGRRYTTAEVDQLDPDEVEVERLVDAIGAACRSTDWCPENSIRDFIRKQR